MTLKTVFAALGVALCGFMVKAEMPATAKWTGGGDRTNLADPLNWSCFDDGGTPMTDVIPDVSKTAVTVTGETTFTCSTNQSPIWKSLTVSGSVKLMGDCDWRGLGTIDNFIAKGAVIDLAGCKLFVSAPSATISKAFKFTDLTKKEVSAPGELHLTVASGTCVNQGITLNGNLRIVKDGAGILGFYKTEHYFKGGIEVFAGTIRADGNPASHVFGGMGVNDTSASAITLHAGGQLDLNGKKAWGYTTFVMDGGTVVGASAQLNPAFVFTAPSTFRVTGDISLNAAVDLGGQTLRIEIDDGKTCQIGSSIASLTNGVLNVVSGGTFSKARSTTAAYNAETDARTVDLILNAAMGIQYGLSVHDYDARWNSDVNPGTGTLKVYGTFTPRTEYFYGCTLQDGATIDLSEKTGVWSTTSMSQGCNTVAFADGATITIDLGDRMVRSGQLVAWTEQTKPSNLATLTFKLSSKIPCILVKRENGLWLIRRDMKLIIR